MKTLVLAVMICLMVGCKIVKQPDPPPPLPTVEIKTAETTDDPGELRIAFYNHLQHRYDGNTTIYWVEITLSTPEEMTAYEKQLQFILDKIKEAKEKMKAMQPPAPVPSKDSAALPAEKS